MKGRLKVAPEVLMWLMKETCRFNERVPYRILKDNLNLKLFFGKSDLNVSFDKNKVLLTIDGYTFRLSLKQFKEEFSSKAKIYFNESLDYINGEEKIIEKFEKLIKKKFGENSIKIEDII